MATFGAVTFSLVVPGFALQAPSKVVVHEIPGGSNWYVHLNGPSPERLSGDVSCASYAVYTNLKALVGTQGSLVWTRGTRTAVLLSLDWHTATKAGAQVARAEWLLL